jgi:hypothetical protein
MGKIVKFDGEEKWFKLKTGYSPWLHRIFLFLLSIQCSRRSLGLSTEVTAINQAWHHVPPPFMLMEWGAL